MICKSPNEQPTSERSLTASQPPSLPTTLPRLRLAQADQLPDSRNTCTIILLTHPSTRRSLPTCQHPGTSRPPLAGRESPRPKRQKLHQARRPPLHRTQSSQSWPSHRTRSNRATRPTILPRIPLAGRHPHHSRTPHHLPGHHLRPNLQ